MHYRTNQQRITAVRTRLLLDFPWFGTLAMRLKIEESIDCPTFRVDGTTMEYNAEFMSKLTDSELTAVLAHEVMHCALLHPYRRENRDNKLWNVATDYAINGELVKAGMKLPKGVKLDPQFDGLSAEVIYARLQKQAPPGGGGENQSQEPEPATGTVQDAPARGDQGPTDQTSQQDSQKTGAHDQPQQMTESDWKIAAEQASAVGKAAGNLPGSAAESVKNARTTPADWRAILREFISQTAPSDYSWTAPNRRYISSGLYLPGTIKENIGHIAVVIDTSASISRRALEEFSAEVTAIAHEARAEKITVLYCDTKVHRQEEYGPDEDITLECPGRGGTAFQPAFDHVAQWEEQPAALVYFTDLDSSDKPAEPEYPVLWATDESVTLPPPFGQLARVGTYGE